MKNAKYINSFKFLLVAMFVIVLTSCSSLTELEATIEQQNSRISELEKELEEQTELTADYQNELLAQQEEIEQLNQELANKLPAFPDFRQGLIADLKENLVDLTIPWIGSPAHYLHYDSIQITLNHFRPTSGQIITQVQYAISPLFIFSFQLDFGDLEQINVTNWTAYDWEHIDINWEVLA